MSRDPVLNWNGTMKETQRRKPWVLFCVSEELKHKELDGRIRENADGLFLWSNFPSNLDRTSSRCAVWHIPQAPAEQQQLGFHYRLCAKLEQYFQNWVFLLSGWVAPTSAAGVDVVNFRQVYYHCNTCTAATQLPATLSRIPVFPITRFPIIAAAAFCTFCHSLASNLRKFSRLMERQRTTARRANNYFADHVFS